MATKFTLQPKPTFKANVSIPRAGDEDGVLTFTFNHKPLKELADLEKLEGKTATDFLMEIISGWAHPIHSTRKISRCCWKTIRLQ